MFSANVGQVIQPAVVLQQGLRAGQLTPGQVVEAEVLTVKGDRAVLRLFGQQLEVLLHATLRAGERLRLQVHLPRPDPEAQAAAGQAARPQVVLKLIDRYLPTAKGETAAPRTVAPEAQHQVVWLPLLLDDGEAWIQLRFQPDDQAGAGAAADEQVVIRWQTPALGKVEVSLVMRQDKLKGLFDADAMAAHQLIQQGLPELAEQLAACGFPDAALGSRAVPQTLQSSLHQAGPQTGENLDRRL